MTPEGAVKKAVSELLESYHVHPAKSVGKTVEKREGWYYMPGQGGRGTKAIPDFIGCYLGGMFFVIETKSYGKKPTKLQQMHLDDIALCGGKAFVITTVEETKYLSEWFDKVKWGA